MRAWRRGSALTDWHIVGRGPSLLTVTADEFGRGPVLTLNKAIGYVRALGLPNPIYTMWKDGCIEGSPHGYLAEPGHDCGLTVEPGETLLLSRKESVNCRPDAPARVVIDVEAFGLPWFYQSAPVAVKWAASQGATRIHMVGHDAYLNGDTRRVDGGVILDTHDAGYFEAGQRAQRIADEASIELVWRHA